MRDCGRQIHCMQMHWWQRAVTKLCLIPWPLSMLCAGLHEMEICRHWFGYDLQYMLELLLNHCPSERTCRCTETMQCWLRKGSTSCATMRTRAWPTWRLLVRRCKESSGGRSLACRRVRSVCTSCRTSCTVFHLGISSRTASSCPAPASSPVLFNHRLPSCVHC